MNTPRILYACALTAVCTIGLNAAAQQAWHGNLNSLMSRIPQTTSCSGGYGLCNHQTAENKSITITGLGTAFTDLQKQLMDAAGAPVPGASMPDPASPPSSGQIEAMKQQAMAKMAAAQNLTPQQAAQMHKSTGSMPTVDPVLMRQVGQAQTAAGQITQLVNEMSQKMNRIHKSWDTIKLTGTCKEVMSGGYAGPTCECEIGRHTSYEQRRTASLNSYLQAVANLAQEYMDRMRPLLSIVDDMEVKAKYGDAITDPSFRQMVVVSQRQAMNGIVSVMALYSGIAKDGAEQQANLLNAALPLYGCVQK